MALIGMGTAVSAQDIYGEVQENPSGVTTDSILFVNEPGADVVSELGDAIETVLVQQSVTTAGNRGTNAGSVVDAVNAGIGFSAFSSVTGNANATDSEEYLFETDNESYSANASASATSTEMASSVVSGNTAENSGDLSSPYGIFFLAGSDANAHADANAVATAEWWDAAVAAASAAATATAVAESTVSGNTATNTGEIDAEWLGISFFSMAAAQANASASASAYAGYYCCGWQWYDGLWTESEAESETATAIADTSGNTALNSGLIDVHSEGYDAADGVNFVATAGGDVEPNVAEATVSGNTLTNDETGVIAVSTDQGTAYGVRLEAVAFGDTEVASVSGNTVTNDGEIAVDSTNGDAAGVVLAASQNGSAADVTGNTVNNGGWLYSDGDGVRVVSDDVAGNTITNTGEIWVDSDGIVIEAGSAADGNTVNNSGLIISAYEGDFSAIRINSADDGENTLNLEAPAYMAGTIELDRAAGVEVNLTSGRSHSVHWTFADEDSDLGAESFTTDGLLPWFERGTNTQDNTDDEFATIDPSAMAARPHQAADLAGMAFALAKDGFAQRADGRNVWISGQGYAANYGGTDDATMDQSTGGNTVAIGLGNTFGGLNIDAMLGYNRSRLEVGTLWGDLYDHSYSNETDGYFIGLNGVAKFTAVDVGFGIAGGAQSHDDTRFINDNTQVLGQDYAQSHYNSRWAAAELSLAANIAVDPRTNLAPMLAGRLVRQSVEGYTESGSNSDAEFGAQNVRATELRLGVEVSRQYGRSTISARVGGLNRAVNNSDEVRVTMIGDTENVPTFARDVQALEIGAGLNVALSDTNFFNIDANYTGGGDADSMNVGVGFQIRF